MLVLVLTIHDETCLYIYNYDIFITKWDSLRLVIDVVGVLVDFSVCMLCVLDILIYMVGVRVDFSMCLHYVLICCDVAGLWRSIWWSMWRSTDYIRGEQEVCPNISVTDSGLCLNIIHPSIRGR